MPHPTSLEIAGRIEDLYGAPLADLEVRAQDQPPGMLRALLGMHHALALAEHGITRYRDQIAQRACAARQITGTDVSHLLDDARRLAEAVAVRDVQATSAVAVLQSLGRLPTAAPPAPLATAPLPAAPSSAHAPAASR